MGLWWQLCGNPFSLPSVFLWRAAGLTVRGPEMEKKKKKKRRLTLLCKHSSRMRSFFQDAHAALTLALQRAGWAASIKARGFETSHALVRPAAGSCDVSSASSDVSSAPSAAWEQPAGCFPLFSTLHSGSINVFAFEWLATLLITPLVQQPQ